MFTQHAYWPTQSWQTATPEQVNINPDVFSHVHALARKQQWLRSVFIVQPGVGRMPMLTALPG